MEFDLVVRNGTIVDGSGAPAYGGDVGVKDGKIRAIGRIRGRGAQETDAEGHVVCPGFIDGHTHMDAQVFWDEIGSNSCWHGVTTVVMGNCGFTLAPAAASDADLVIRNLERAEDIPRQAMQAGIKDWSWETYPEYLNVLDHLPKGINYAGYVGHSALRTWAMGERAFEEPANEDDLLRMERGLHEALDAGAMGFSTSRSRDHETANDDPVASRVAEWGEVERLVHLLSEHGSGIFQFPAIGMGLDQANEPAVELAERLCQLVADTGITVMSSIPVMFDDARDQLFMFDVLERINRLGHGRAIGQVVNRAISVICSFKSRMPFDTVPEWKDVRSRPLEEQRRILADPDQRAALVAAAYQGAYRKAIGAEARKPETYGDLRMVGDTYRSQLSVGDVAAKVQKDPIDVIIDFALDTNFEQLFDHQIANVNEADVYRGLTHPATLLAASDAGAHVNQICSDSMHTYLLAHWVRERQTFELEHAIRMLTFDIANAWGLRDRGLVAPGMAADLVVFDPSTVAPHAPRQVSDLPGGSTRLVQGAVGVRNTIVNGQVLLEDGQATDARAGRVLRRTSYMEH